MMKQLTLSKMVWILKFNPLLFFKVGTMTFDRNKNEANINSRMEGNVEQGFINIKSLWSFIMIYSSIFGQCYGRKLWTCGSRLWWGEQWEGSSVLIIYVFLLYFSIQKFHLWFCWFIIFWLLLFTSDCLCMDYDSFNIFTF